MFLGMQTLKSTQAMADAMRGATKAMGAMNKQMNLPALTKIMRDFERQNEKMEMTSEMMGDAVDDAFEVCFQPYPLVLLKRLASVRSDYLSSLGLPVPPGLFATRRSDIHGTAPLMPWSVSRRCIVCRGQS